VALLCRVSDALYTITGALKLLWYRNPLKQCIDFSDCRNSSVRVKEKWSCAHGCRYLSDCTLIAEPSITLWPLHALRKLWSVYLKSCKCLRYISPLAYTISETTYDWFSDLPELCLESTVFLNNSGEPDDTIRAGCEPTEGHSSRFEERCFIEQK
jgi:hypothetical protein